MNQVSVLKLIKYDVNSIVLKKNDSYSSVINGYRINPDFNRVVKRIDDKTFEVYLNLLIKEDIKNINVPYFVDLTLSGRFSMENWESNENKSITLINTTAILFPYLRTLLTTITSNTNIPPYVLPVTNITNLFK